MSLSLTCTSHHEFLNQKPYPLRSFRSHGSGILQSPSYSTTFPIQPKSSCLNKQTNALQVFHTTPYSFALVNIKPILPGHVLVVPFRRVPRVTDLSTAEITDLFTTVQKIQRMLAKRYFPSSDPSPSSSDPLASSATLANGSFNLAIQDGEEAGQTVPHVHCHIIPRTRAKE